MTANLFLHTCIVNSHTVRACALQGHNSLSPLVYCQIMKTDNFETVFSPYLSSMLQNEVMQLRDQLQVMKSDRMRKETQLNEMELALTQKSGDINHLQQQLQQVAILPVLPPSHCIPVVCLCSPHPPTSSWWVVVPLGHSHYILCSTSPPTRWNWPRQEKKLTFEFVCFFLWHYQKEDIFFYKIGSNSVKK